MRDTLHSPDSFQSLVRDIRDENVVAVKINRVIGTYWRTGHRSLLSCFSCFAAHPRSYYSTATESKEKGVQQKSMSLESDKTSATDHEGGSAVTAAEFEAPNLEIDPLRHREPAGAAVHDSILAERDAAIRERDRAVAALHRGTVDASADVLNDFAEYVIVPRWRPLDYPRIHVETEASDQDLDKMCSRLAAAWTVMGESEPFFTNVAHHKFMMENIAESKGEFFRTGVESLHHVEAIVQRQGITVSAYRDCFELGCGVGRLTTALTGVFDKVYGMDVSASHLRVARENLAVFEGQVDLRLFEGLASIDALPRFDLFVSFAVLQHNPPPLAARLLDRILSKIRIGGAACFQCQTYQTGYRFEVDEYLSTIGSSHRDLHGAQCGWEMHCLPQSVIYRLLERHGFALLEVREDAGQAYGITQVFFAVREREPGAA